MEDAFDEDPDPAHDFPLYLGEITQTMLRDFVLLTAELDTDALFIDVTSPDTHKVLMGHYGRTIFDKLRIDRIDEGSFFSRDRAITRRIAGDLYDLTSVPVHSGCVLSALTTPQRSAGQSGNVAALPLTIWASDPFR